LDVEKSDGKNRVDHIDKMRNNCRKYNLRICTHHQNNMNKGLDNRSKSGVSGVRWNKDCKGWDVDIVYNYETIRLGVYRDFKDGVKTRLLEELKYFGEYAPQQHLWNELEIIFISTEQINGSSCSKVYFLKHFNIFRIF